MMKRTNAKTHWTYWRQGLEALVAPPDQLTNSQERSQARTFQVAMLMLSLFTLFTTWLDKYVLQGNSGVFTENESLATTIGQLSSLAFVLLYFISRMGYFRVAAFTAGLVALTTIFFMTSASFENHVLIIYALTVPMIGSLILPRWVFRAVTAATIAMIMLFVLVQTSFSMRSRIHLLIPSVVITVCAVIIEQRRYHIKSRSSIRKSELPHSSLLTWRLGEDLKIKEVTRGDQGVGITLLNTLMETPVQRAQLLASIRDQSSLTLQTHVATRHYYSLIEPLNGGGVVGTSLDITELEAEWSRHGREMVEKQQSDLLSEFMRSAAHDIRTPLSILKTSLYLLKRTSDPERQADRLAIMDATLNNLNALIEDMFLMIRIDTMAIYEARKLDIEMMAASLAHSRKGVAEKNGITLIFQALTPLPLLCGHGTYLEKALGEFIDNALQYTAPGGTITVSASSDNDHIKFNVVDTGCGIEAVDLPYIFDRFYRAEKHRHHEEHIHSGLGLARAKKIIEKHGGNILVTSKTGEGSTFIILLPHNTNCTENEV
jgi:signal transduction histidine kinase